MRSMVLEIIEGLHRGLRNSEFNQRNVGGLVECHNVRPTEYGLEPYEEITSLNASGITWGGEGKFTGGTYSRAITIDVTDYVDDTALETVSVYIDDVLEGTTDANGELTIDNVAVGTHTIKLTKTGYTDSDADVLLNDLIVVT